LAFTRRIADTPAEQGVRLDLVGTVLSALGLGLIVYGILRAGTWGFVHPKEGAPHWPGLSPGRALAASPRRATAPARP